MPEAFLIIFKHFMFFMVSCLWVAVISMLSAVK